MITSPRSHLATLVVASLTVVACAGSDESTNEMSPVDTAVATDPVTTDVDSGTTASGPEPQFETSQSSILRKNFWWT